MKCGNSRNVENNVKYSYVFLFHTGNPGIVGFYRTFMQTVHSMFGYRHPVWAVSHAGHCVPPDSMDMVEGIDYSHVLYTSEFLH